MSSSETNIKDVTSEEYQRVSETKNVFPEDYKCRSHVEKKDKFPKHPKLDETICKSIGSNKLNATLKKQNCSHCGEIEGKCCCTSDESRKEMTRLNEFKPIEQEKSSEGGTTNMKE